MQHGAVAHAQVDPMPLVTSSEWEDWYLQLLQDRVDEVTFTRDQTRYVSSSDGDDRNDGLTPGTAWKSIDKVLSWINEPVQETREILFRRGDAWHSNVGVTTNQPGIRIADFGDSRLPRPRISGFTLQWPAGSGSWEPVKGSRNTWSVQSGQEVHWVRQDHDADLDRPMARVQSVVAVDERAGSFFYDQESGILYVHPRDGVDPDTAHLEGCTSSGRGIQVKGDLALVENMRADGWGMNGSQEDAIQSQARNGDRNVIRNCHAFYSRNHVITHWNNGPQGNDGTATFIDCTAGFTSYYGSSGETIFNSYTAKGGSSTIFHRCTAARGTLPSWENDFSSARAFPFYCHTSGFPGYQLDLVILYDFTVTAHEYGCKTTPSMNQLKTAFELESVRGIIYGIKGHGLTAAKLFNNNMALLNADLKLLVEDNSARALQNFKARGWLINAQVEMDLSQIDVGFLDKYSLYNATTTDNRPNIWHSHLVFKNMPPGMKFQFDNDGSASSRFSTMFKTVLSKWGPYGQVHCNLTDPTCVINNNAYFEIPSMPNDPKPVFLLQQFPTDTPPPASSLIASSNGILPGNQPLSFDINGIRRNQSSLGPIEVLPPPPCIADLDSDGSVSGKDLGILLSQWGCIGECPGDLDGNGLVDGSDMGILLAGWGSCP